MNPYIDHANGLDELAAELGDDCPVFRYNDANFKCLPGGAKFSRQNDVGGIKLESDLQLTCTISQFGGSIPDAGEALFYLGREYTITAVTPIGFQMRINADLNAMGM